MAKKNACSVKAGFGYKKPIFECGTDHKELCDFFQEKKGQIECKFDKQTDDYIGHVCTNKAAQKELIDRIFFKWVKFPPAKAVDLKSERHKRGERN